MKSSEPIASPDVIPHRRGLKRSDLDRGQLALMSNYSKMIGKRLVHTARSIVFSNYGAPKEALSVLKHEIPDPTGDQSVLKLVGAPINPADLNQVEGVYPSKPRFIKNLGGLSYETAIGGNEGCFEVVEPGPESSLKPGDWVVPRIASFGTWTTAAIASEKDLIKIPRSGLAPLQAATISVNPSTAYRMLSDFAELEPGEWFIQNGANSGVGRMAIQIGRLWGYKSINVVRDRKDIESLKAELTELGADHVITEEQINDKSIKHIINDWTGDSDIKLALNCVGGRSATNIARQLGKHGKMVTYGGMSKQPVSFPTSLFIFKNVSAHGFWLTRWNSEHKSARETMLREIADMYSQNEIKESAATSVAFDVDGSDDSLLQTFLNALEAKGKQVLIAESKQKS